LIAKAVALKSRAATLIALGHILEEKPAPMQLPILIHHLDLTQLLDVLVGVFFVIDIFPVGVEVFINTPVDADVHFVLRGVRIVVGDLELRKRQSPEPKRFDEISDDVERRGFIDDNTADGTRIESYFGDVYVMMGLGAVGGGNVDEERVEPASEAHEADDMTARRHSVWIEERITADWTLDVLDEIEFMTFFLLDLLDVIRGGLRFLFELRKSLPETGDLRCSIYRRQ